MGCAERARGDALTKSLVGEEYNKVSIAKEAIIAQGGQGVQAHGCPHVGEARRSHEGQGSWSHRRPRRCLGQARPQGGGHTQRFQQKMGESGREVAQAGATRRGAMVDAVGTTRGERGVCCCCCCVVRAVERAPTVGKIPATAATLAVAPTSLPAPRAALSTSPTPRAAPSTDPHLTWPSTSAACFVDPAVVYDCHERAAPSAPTDLPARSRTEPPMYHLITIHRDVGHVHLMVTRSVADVLCPVDRLILTADAPPDAFPVPSSLRTALADPH
jgi:hypothetical protein